MNVERMQTPVCSPEVLFPYGERNDRLYRSMFSSPYVWACIALGICFYGSLGGIVWWLA